MDTRQQVHGKTSGGFWRYGTGEETQIRAKDDKCKKCGEVGIVKHRLFCRKGWRFARNELECEAVLLLMGRSFCGTEDCVSYGSRGGAVLACIQGSGGYLTVLRTGAQWRSSIVMNVSRGLHCMAQCRCCLNAANKKDSATAGFICGWRHPWLYLRTTCEFFKLREVERLRA